MRILDHTHTFAQFKKRHGWFRCLDPKCYFQCDKEIAVGKLTRCTACGAEFVLDRESARRRMPKCLTCSNTQKAREVKAAANILDNLDIFKTSGKPAAAPETDKPLDWMP